MGRRQYGEEAERQYGEEAERQYGEEAERQYGEEAERQYGERHHQMSVSHSTHAPRGPDFLTLAQTWCFVS